MADTPMNLAPSKSGSGRSQPSSWWQWILVYPAVAVALIGAAPAWVDAGKAYLLDLDASELDEAERFREFVGNNLSCFGAPELWIENPENILVDGTICTSGDVLIKVQIPKPIDKVFFRAITVADIVERHTEVAGLPGLTAHAAAPARTPKPGAAPQPGFAEGAGALAQTFSIAVCQKIVDDRTILRHVKVGRQCFDEYIDAYTGEMRNRVETSCRTSC